MISFVEALARQEGFGRPDTRATRNHNPGNLNYTGFTRAHGAVGPDDKGYAIFATNTEGFAALKSLLESPSYKGLTVAQAIGKYCPPSGDPRGDNNTAVYIRNVCNWCATSENELLSKVLSKDIQLSNLGTAADSHQLQKKG